MEVLRHFSRGKLNDNLINVKFVQCLFDLNLSLTDFKASVGLMLAVIFFNRLYFKKARSCLILSPVQYMFLLQKLSPDAGF